MRKPSEGHGQRCPWAELSSFKCSFPISGFEKPHFPLDAKSLAPASEHRRPSGSQGKSPTSVHPLPTLPGPAQSVWPHHTLSKPSRSTQPDPSTQPRPTSPTPLIPAPPPQHSSLGSSLLLVCLFAPQKLTSENRHFPDCPVLRGLDVMHVSPNAMHPCQAIHSKMNPMGRRAGKEIATQNNICKNNMCKTRENGMVCPMSLSPASTTVNTFSLLLLSPQGIFLSHFFPLKTDPVYAFILRCAFSWFGHPGERVSGASSSPGGFLTWQTAFCRL